MEYMAFTISGSATSVGFLVFSPQVTCYKPRSPALDCGVEMALITQCHQRIIATNQIAATSTDIEQQFHLYNK
jgi:hypothetical protein